MQRLPLVVGGARARSIIMAAQTTICACQADTAYEALATGSAEPSKGLLFFFPRRLFLALIREAEAERTRIERDQINNNNNNSIT